MMRKSERPKRQRLDAAGYAALAGFRRALRVFMAFSEDAARAAGLTAQQHQAILAIRGFGSAEGLAINDLAEQLLLKPQTAVELADRLELAGLVRRNRDRGDRRRVFLTLTDKADQLLDDLSAAHLAQIRRDAPDLIQLLRRMAEDGDAG